MKIIETTNYGYKEMSVSEAVVYATTPDAYSYGGQLEKLERQIEKQQELLVRLIETMFDDKFNNILSNKLEYILGYGFKVEINSK